MYSIRFHQVMLTGLASLFIGSESLDAQTGLSLGRPNIILINLDDADADLLKPEMLNNYYPNMRGLAQRGLRFTNMHATTPFCAPSRAALFRGQYAFETGIKVNDPENITSNGFSGGYGEFLARGHDQAELGVWLKNAGYRTMHVGKYHHHNFDNRVPPGWDDFRVSLGARYFGTFRFTNQTNENGSFYRTGEDEYITTIEGSDAVELIQQQSQTTQPFFLYVAPIAPHAAGSFVPEDKVDPVYANFAEGLSIPRTPDLYEEDVSDKPRHLRFETSQGWRNYNQRSFISRVRAIKSVDDMVGRINAALHQSGQLENTIILLTSDNGFQLGHHNLQNKTDPYQRTTNLPLLVAGPGIASGTYSHLLAHIDLCPTILELADAQIPSSVTAKSFRPLLERPQDFAQQNWQDGIMIENWSKKRNYQSTVVGSYVAYRRHHDIFVSWANGQHEYYDLAADPFQLNNQYESLSIPQKQDLKRLVRRFRTRQVLPTTTLDQIYRDKLQNRNVKVRGYAEDDAGIFGTLLTMRSFTTNRYWNGEAWQDEWYGHFVNARNRNQPISLWTFKTRMKTETQSGFDYLVFTYRSLDSDGVLPHEVGYHINSVDGKSPIARFEDYGEEQPRFGTSFALSGTQYDAVELQRSILTIRNVDTDQYFDGTGFQDGRFSLSVESQPGGGNWTRILNLPPGRYIAGIRAIDKAGNLQHPANTLRFRVVDNVSNQ